jgi:mannose-6-phosphate isomerase-like protein (cupin superfamily)
MAGAAQFSTQHDGPTDGVMPAHSMYGADPVLRLSASRLDPGQRQDPSTWRNLALTGKVEDTLRLNRQSGIGGLHRCRARPSGRRDGVGRRADAVRRTDHPLSKEIPAVSHFHKWDEITQDKEPGPTLPAGMSRRGIMLGDVMLALHGAVAGLKAEPHSHPNDQIAIMIKGRMLMEIDGEQRIMTPGEFAYVPRNVVHRIQTLDEDAIVLDVFCPSREDIARRLAELDARNSG